MGWFLRIQAIKAARIWQSVRLLLSACDKQKGMTCARSGNSKWTVFSCGLRCLDSPEIASSLLHRPTWLQFGELHRLLLLWIANIALRGRPGYCPQTKEAPLSRLSRAASLLCFLRISLAGAKTSGKVAVSPPMSSTFASVCPLALL